MKTRFLIIALVFGAFMTMHGQICYNFANKKYHQEVIKNAENSPTDGRISLRLAGNGSFVTILLGFIPEGTTNFDDGFDGPFINDGAVVEFYSFMGTMRLSIQALPELTNVNVQVPLGCELTSDGNYTISIDAEFLSTDFDIILEDSQQNIFTDLRQTSYTFSGITGEIHNRFYLNLDYRNALNIQEETQNTKAILAYFDEAQLKLHTQRTDLETVTIFTPTGKHVFLQT
ncbi:MAG: hypothetical protein AAF617_07155 [Bacteroidota bacterium]